MKQTGIYLTTIFIKTGSLFLCFLLLIGTIGCIKDHDSPLNNYKQVNLVSDVAGFGAARIDSTLVNAWGISVVPSGPIWISANHTGISTVYNITGASLRPNVVIPAASKTDPGAPTGQVFNSTPDFVIPSNGAPSKFIFAGEDGTISAWNGGNAAILVANRAWTDAVYKGLAMAKDGDHNFIYATNFKGGKIDVYDDHFNFVTDKPFWDPGIPSNFGPFNIRNISGKLYVTYAKHKAPDNMDDEAGPGNGFVDIFSPDGKLLKRFASRGKLNSPWGIVIDSVGFSEHNNSILIGNFGDGRINVFEQKNGEFEGQLKDKNMPISIEGLWALENKIPGSSPNQLFFTAGPGGEEHGLFGYILKK